MADLTCKWEHQDFFCRNFSSQKTCVSNSRVLTLAQSYKLRKFWLYGARCANEDAKKAKEKNTTNLAIYYGTLLVTTAIIYETTYFYKTNY